MEKRGYEYGTSNWEDAQGRNIRTNGCIMLFCEEGMAMVSVEFKRMSVRKGDIVLIFPDTLFVVNDVSKLFKTRYIEISAALFDEATFTLSSQFFDVLYDVPIFHTQPEHRELLKAWEEFFLWITRCTSSKPVYLMLRNHLQNFFLGMESIIMSEGVRTHIQPISTTRQLFNRFCCLLMEYCYAQHEVEFYAEQLCITPYYLSKITDKTVNATPKELIDRQIILEMKWLLTTTDISIKELASRFHFDTMSYMARFFRRHTGLTPNEFRKQ